MHVITKIWLIISFEYYLDNAEATAIIVAINNADAAPAELPDPINNHNVTAQVNKVANVIPETMHNQHYYV